ncbi:MAG: hypothetical protein IIT46_15655 [Lachnospiraceae bacterium]|nr:hypothetical protein [Lachnospiraceae bacterium]
MTDAHPLLKDLTEQLLKEVMQYVLEVSVEQYQSVCNSILKYAGSSNTNTYSSELIDAYKNILKTGYLMVRSAKSIDAFSSEFCICYPHWLRQVQWTFLE